MLDMLPAAAFLLGYFLPSDRENAMYIGIIATICASMATVVGWRLLYGEWRKLHLVSLLALLVLGGGSLLLQNKAVFLWKPTVVYLLFAGVFLVSQALRRPMTKLMMSEFISMPDTSWLRLNLAWAGLFLLLSALNMIVAWNFTEEEWAVYKVFGPTVLMVLFMLAQLPFLYKVATPVADGEGDQRT